MYPACLRGPVRSQAHFTTPSQHAVITTISPLAFIRQFWESRILTMRHHCATQFYQSSRMHLMKYSRLSLVLTLLLILPGTGFAQESQPYRVRTTVHDCLHVRDDHNTSAPSRTCLAPGTAVTVIESVPYWRHIQYGNNQNGWAAKNPVALVVKLADVTDNMDLGRIPNPTEKDFARLKEYEEVKELLESAAE